MEKNLSLRRPRKLVGKVQPNPPDGTTEPPAQTQEQGESKDWFDLAVEKRLAHLREETSTQSKERAKYGPEFPNPTQDTKGQEKKPVEWPIVAERLVITLKSAVVLDPELRNLRTPAMQAVMEALARAENALELHYEKAEMVRTALEIQFGGD